MINWCVYDLVNLKKRDLRNVHNRKGALRNGHNYCGSGHLRDYLPRHIQLLDIYVSAPPPPPA